jgi:hypothetical protein
MWIGYDCPKTLIYNIPFTLDGTDFSLLYSLPKRTKMANYLLLRSNKKSGPYSLQDLVNFGLKAYDLVWVEGKSASWRYPSELEELKPYAPVVEEQPFDRFFKKNTPVIEQTALLQAQQAAIAQRNASYNQIPQVQQPVSQVIQQPAYVQEEKVIPQQPAYVQEEKVIPRPQVIMAEQKPVIEQKQIIEEKPIVQQPAYEEQYEKYLPKKSVFVTMPGNKSVVVQKPVETRQEPVPVPPPTPVMPAAAIPAATITVKENPEAQIKYSQPLDEIKEMYVKTLQERKSKMIKRSQLLSFMKKAAVIAGLVALGVVTGLIINRGSGTNNTLSQANPLKENGAAITKDISPVTPSNDQAAEDNTSQIIQPDNSLLENTPIKNLNTEIVNPPSSLPRNEREQLLLRDREQEESSNNRREPVSRGQSQQVYEERPLQTDPRTGERNRNTRNENDVLEEENRPAAKAILKPRKSGLESQVSISSNDYKRVAFGGIRNLELTVTNESKFILDKVTVELQYLKPSEEPLRTELIQFHSISPNGAMTMKVRDTNRGIKVLYRIIDIQAAGHETALNGF